ncbi:hypothetical protein J6590_054313 [Homalodisca vitripennis]|nr:hypothetical protein J6590_054313 [Homalodisca vitripennis]
MLRTTSAKPVVTRHAIPLLASWANLKALLSRDGNCYLAATRYDVILPTDNRLRTRVISATVADLPLRNEVLWSSKSDQDRLQTMGVSSPVSPALPLSLSPSWEVLQLKDILLHQARKLLYFSLRKITIFSYVLPSEKFS